MVEENHVAFIQIVVVAEHHVLVHRVDVGEGCDGKEENRRVLGNWFVPGRTRKVVKVVKAGEVV